MLYVVIILAALVTALLILRCRVTLHLSADEKKLFVGLGRSGPEFDLANETSTIKLFGFHLKTVVHRQLAAEKRHRTGARIARKYRRRLTLSIGESLELAGRTIRTLWKGQRSLLKGVRLEELNGELIAGFESPDQTGIAYGCYHAAIGIAPQIGQRFHFVPYWQGSHFGGQLNASLAIPLYRVVYELLSTILQLPLRKFARITIGRRKGVRDVK